MSMLGVEERCAVLFTALEANPAKHFVLDPQPSTLSTRIAVSRTPLTPLEALQDVFSSRDNRPSFRIVSETFARQSPRFFLFRPSPLTSSLLMMHAYGRVVTRGIPAHPLHHCGFRVAAEICFLLPQNIVKAGRVSLVPAKGILQMHPAVSILGMWA